MNDDVYIIVPVYNEAEMVQRVVCKLLEKYTNVVVVDDGSNDGSHECLMDTGVIILRHIVNLGQGAALQTGLVYAISKGARYIVTFDADGQHAVEDIENLLIPLRTKEYEIALGSRFLGEALDMPPIRKWMIRIAVFLSSHFIHKQIFTDTHNGLRAFSASAASKICITQNRMAHASQILKQIVKNHLKYVEVPVTIKYSEYSLKKGQSIFNSLDILIELIEEKLFR